MRVADVAHSLGYELGVRGPRTVLPTACAAGNSALAAAADLIRDGRADTVLALGVDELSEAMFMMFSSFRALSPDVVRPFDLDRQGLLLSEGAGALVVERAEVARRRGARAYCRVAGHASVADAFHMTAPHPDGRGAAAAMRSALADGGLSPADVDYVSAHGTGTPANDVSEAKALVEVFGRLDGPGQAGRVPAVSSIKSMTGHTQGAASAVEAVSCVLAMHRGAVPPTANLERLDPACEIDVVGPAPRPADVRVALNNAFGFGGSICCTVLVREEDER